MATPLFPIPQRSNQDAVPISTDVNQIIDNQNILHSDIEKNENDIANNLEKINQNKESLENSTTEIGDQFERIANLEEKSRKIPEFDFDFEYEAEALVSESAEIYESLESENKGNLPSTSPDFWRVRTLSFDVMDALEGANLPTVDNVFATMSEIKEIRTNFSRRKKVMDVINNTLPPPTESENDRYILDFIPGDINPIYGEAKKGDIIEFDGTVWNATTPNEGWIVYVDNINKEALFIDDGTPTWEVKPSIIVNHSDLSDDEPNKHRQINDQSNSNTELLSANKINSSFLSKTNTVSYSPSEDFHPATKKYVDDKNVGSDLPKVNIDKNLGETVKQKWLSIARWIGYNGKFSELKFSIRFGSSSGDNHTFATISAFAINKSNALAMNGVPVELSNIVVHNISHFNNQGVDFFPLDKIRIVRDVSSDELYIQVFQNTTLPGDVGASLEIHKNLGWEIIEFEQTILSSNLEDYTVNFKKFSNTLTSRSLLVNEHVYFDNLASGTGTQLVIDSNNEVKKLTSSIKYKEEINPILKPERIYKLNPVSFKWKTSGEDDFGLIAEEVHAICPELVIKNKDNKIESVKYSQLPVFLLAEIKNLKNEIDDLKTKLKRILND